MAKYKIEGWRGLYRLAEQLDRLDPWGWMEVPDCFGIAIPGWDEPAFMLLSGESESYRSARLLMGWKPVYNFIARIANPKMQTPGWLWEIPMLELQFMTPELLFDFEVTHHKRYGIKPDDKGFTPTFRSIRPGYHPWRMELAERRLMEHALYQLLGMALRIEREPQMLSGRFPREVLIRTMDESGVWSDVWERVKSLQSEEVEVDLAGDWMRRLVDGPTQPMTVQVDLLFTPLRLRYSAGRRPQTAYILMVVESSSGFILRGELMQACDGVPEMWSRIPEVLLRTFDRMGGCPEAVEVSSERMAELLRPLTELLPFKMVWRKKLDKVEQAQADFESLLLDEERLSGILKDAEEWDSEGDDSELEGQ